MHRRFGVPVAASQNWGLGEAGTEVWLVLFLFPLVLRAQFC